MKILFLGDSITDSYHSFAPDNLGDGYVRMICEHLRKKDPGLVAANKGIDGFTVPRVYEMWQSLPDKSSWDIVSVLVGVNDVGLWMDRDYSSRWLQDALREFRSIYEDLVTDILDYGIPKLVLMEPFIFRQPEKYQLWRPFLQEISIDIRQIANRYRLPFLPLQEMLDRAAETQEYDAVTLDGIHLTATGNQMLADTWITSMQNLR